MKKLIITFLITGIMSGFMSLSVCADKTTPDMPPLPSGGGGRTEYTTTTYDHGKYTVEPVGISDGSVIIFACYNDGALAYVDYKTYSSQSTSDIQFTVTSGVDYDSAKVFVWGSLSGMSPITFAEPVEVTNITPLTDFSVVDNTSIGFNDKGEMCNIITAYTSESRAAETFVVDNDASMPELQKGDVVLLSFGSDGEIIEIKKLYTPDNSAAATEAMWSAAKAMTYDNTAASKHYLSTGIPALDDTYVSDENWARVGFGIITDKNNASVKLVSAHKATNDEIVEGSGIAVGDIISVDADDTLELNLSVDLNVYMYGYSTRPRLHKGSVGNISLTRVLSSAKYECPDGKIIYKWDKVSAINYAFYKVTNGEITDILVIYPEV